MSDLPSCLLIPPLRLTAEIPGIGGIFKQNLEDFVVEEIPAYLPGGAGEHLFLWIEKRDMGAEFFQRQIAQRLGISTGEIGTAGMKDRRAVTRQWVSVPARCESQVSQLDGEGITVLQASKHGNKLRPGHLHGNRFTIVLREIKEAGSLERLLNIVQTQGLPNYYGNQRFGRDNETLMMGWRMLHGERLKFNPFLKKLALSAVQSALFNRCLHLRLQEGLFRKVLDGDVMAKWPAGGMFVTHDTVTEQQRFDAREIVHTGPMYGSRMKASEGAEAEREAAVLQECGLTVEQFNVGGKLLEGTRRHNLIYVEELECKVDGTTVTLQFRLPAGCYATTLLSELMKTDSDAADGD